ncbi:MAG: TerB N-terminal domain-containing protein [Oscillospiraceae bacterium]
MGDINDIINTVMSESKIIGKVYSDEPIIRTASNLPNFVPEKITEFKENFSKREYLGYSNSKKFYVMGKYMEDFEDSFDRHKSYFCYFPTYSQMDVKQLRTYFTWRTKVRKGIIEETSLSYVYLYMYELINLIGVKSAEEAFYALKSLYEGYYPIDKSIKRYYRKWAAEMVIYYDMPVNLLEGILDLEYENAANTLIDFKKRSDDELFSAITRISSYNPEKSAFCKKYHDDFSAVAAAVYRKWAEYCDLRCKRSLSERLFGVKLKFRVYFFDDAVFFDNGSDIDREYVVNENHRYFCTDGKYFAEKYELSGKKNAELGAVIRETDRLMRIEYGFDKELSSELDSKTLVKLITGEIKSFIEEKRKREARIVRIDTSQLLGIRRDADIIRDKLMTDEDKSDDSEITENISEETSDISDDASPLDENENKFLRLMLSGGDFSAFASENHLMVSVLCDSINEKLFDMFGDTVIEYIGDEPSVIEDYEEELKGIVNL